MAFSFNDIMQLNEKKPILNNSIRFFSHEHKHYAYLNKMPGKISLMEIGPGFKKILQQFDASKTVNEIINTNTLDVNFFEFIKSFYENSVLLDNSPEEHSASETIMLTFFPTTACGLRCLYCYISTGEGSTEMINIEKAEAWINYVFKRRENTVKKVHVMFHGGGEPTIAFNQMKSIWEYVKKISAEENLRHSMAAISNGMFNDNVTKWLINEKAFVMFSIDGDAEVHDKVRLHGDGRGSFKKAYANLKMMRAAGLKVGIRATVSRMNLKHLRQLIDLCKQNGINRVEIAQCSSYGRNEDMNKTAVSNEEFIEYYLDAWDYALNEGICLRGYASMSLQRGKNYFCSNYSDSSFCLTSDGYLSSCTEVVKKEDPASEAFFTGEINENNTVIFYDGRIRKLKERNPYNITACRNCFLENVCSSGCAVKSYRSKGNLLWLFEEECRFMKQISPLLLKKAFERRNDFRLRLNAEYLSYSSVLNSEIYADYAAFDPLS